ncbi:uncharacterized protein LOC123528108 [Mercenaria mercenaria]|uniref:uncharacterized protein LOC123528108 n=1 Tax=Mercenaria mercenaria TaxID=6596 RepID=UPI00234F0B49|nr:uncharacterized protein LOC123528108 [Mercenaria mercenaria]
MKRQVETLVVREVQQTVYQQEITSLLAGRPVPKTSSILRLDPYLDQEGMLRVGGRLSKSTLSDKEKHPLLLPGKHHVSKLLVTHIHNSIKHQGRLITEGAIRSAGFWVTGAKPIVSTLLHICVVCRKLRGRFEYQKMSDLPVDHVKEAKPFSFVGVDVFGPWQIVSRRTRGGQANSKRWAVLFTCLTIRSVNIEVIEKMTSSAFTNALRRFIAIRGKVTQYRSDRGTNFVGATDKLGSDAINVEDAEIKKYRFDSDAVWVFNPPHSSHMGGVWERMIGISRRILDSMLLKTPNLTHDVLVTLMAEVSAIVNARPIVPVSDDAECPDILSPSALLNMKLQTSQPISECGSLKNIYKDQWRRVQFLAEQFWVRWRRDYLQSLQSRPKWLNEEVPLKVDDIVLLKDGQAPRNSWPMARVSQIFPSSDNRIRKVEISFFREGKQIFLTRSVVELVVLVRA